MNPSLLVNTLRTFLDEPDAQQYNDVLLVMERGIIWDWYYIGRPSTTGSFDRPTTGIFDPKIGDNKQRFSLARKANLYWKEGMVDGHVC